MVVWGCSHKGHGFDWLTMYHTHNLHVAGKSSRRGIMNSVIAGLALTLCLVSLANAQFYAPDTEFHDRAQRLFPVEATRVLACRENLANQRVSEIAYKVGVDTNRITTWNLVCLDKDSNSVKTITVSYPEALLSSGQNFYREVFKQ